MQTSSSPGARRIQQCLIMRRRFHHVTVTACRIARPQDRPANQPTNRIAISIVELLVALAIIGLLMALLVPAISQARLLAQRTRCVNNLRNISFGLTQFDHLHKRLPASGTYFDPDNQPSEPRHSWAVSILPWINQGNLYDQWDLDQAFNSPHNLPLTQTSIPIYQCPLDPSLSGGSHGDQSYAVNGGVGFTHRTREGVADCPIDREGKQIDFNGDGLTCTGTTTDQLDLQLFKRMGLFFLENWKQGETKRHYSIAEIIDGTSQTFLVSENIRTGFNPDQLNHSFADPHPRRSAFYIGSPCENGDCTAASVNYQRCNEGLNRINGGLTSPEGSSPVPNSLHEGGVNMAYADGHVAFLSESIDGAVYAALASAQGLLLDKTSLQQVIIDGDFF